jgi:pSer/pThr/pTyr-binding forkhead associated (FHA) protein
MAVLLVHANGDQVGSVVRLQPDTILIGRDQDCDLVTESRFTSVSQHHAVLQRTPGGWTITDVGTRGEGSSYGTHINGIRLNPNRPAVLHPGYEIRLGTKLGKYLRFQGEGTLPISETMSLEGRLAVDVGRRCLLLDGRMVSISLTRQEFEFLLLLWKKSGSVCTFREIIAHLWPNETTLTHGSIDADLRVRVNTVAHGLRRKLRFAFDDINLLESSRGVGYRLRL